MLVSVFTRLVLLIEEESALIEKFKTVTHNEIYAFTPNDIAEFLAFTISQSGTSSTGMLFLA